MGDVANGEEPQLHQIPAYPDSIHIPATPGNTPDDTMHNAAAEHMEIQNVAPSEISSAVSAHTTNDTEPQYNNEPPSPIIENEDEDDSLPRNTNLVIPITNPSAFPVQRIQEVQSQHYPSTSIVNIFCHKTPSGPIVRVTADIQDGSVNHLLIRDQRLISALGLAPPDFDVINIDTSKLHLDETFRINILPGQRPQNPDVWIMGELLSARHAYLYWLDERRTADPKHRPYAAEAKAIARKIGRRWPDVMREIEGVWKLEQGGNREHYRKDRLRYLGEDPTYPEGAGEGRVVRSMFG
ncbi:hypothetical protein EKO04_011170 [Ascochyta lentis]|uniref:HMG box domain-containing protein n=1 Tax=Ascochyta lentis TaxID=205686 RepID=A0A8H7MBH7_9PLEO|nr:hypothetical protein EKO04_011170 [Ascochyta lentis]